jgi:hypothetical protein
MSSQAIKNRHKKLHLKPDQAHNVKTWGNYEKFHCHVATKICEPRTSKSNTTHLKLAKPTSQPENEAQRKVKPSRAIQQ